MAMSKSSFAKRPFSLKRAFGSLTAHTSTSQRRIVSARWKQVLGNRNFLSDFSHSQQPFRRFFQSSRTRYAAQPQQPGVSLSQRLRNLSKEYGWSALWVYLLLSAMDFPICFAAVRLLGVDRIGHYEHVIVESVKGVVDTVWPITQDVNENSDQNKALTSRPESQEDAAKTQDNGENASLWTQLALAYAVHKSLIFIRVPLTAAITPKVVKVLRQWGYDIVKGRPKGL
ncbi:uncharacterized protein BP01DRAFT_359998 [Aspergillus saccharolyticus JOP 1030-1]|uniref:DUF1279 domain-containing protein n=1 Tax=Aspergillus saccharolyticus JOP 1030-1 TaxID=1450539 RepID=A0A318Z3E9_9EURO|nr:hypothetical protein BP01DRAFT_359998 [Aspergillus saccharolyticus JOP 1030-1]PYH41805.1 hypothetical protein BP01DRAFT_359998 [Aspergillus saccharolyticus JOP 1030-1]